MIVIKCVLSLPFQIYAEKAPTPAMKYYAIGEFYSINNFLLLFIYILFIFYLFIYKGNMPVIICNSK